LKLFAASGHLIRVLRLPFLKILSRDTPDGEVVLRAQKGDSDAFRLLFERHGTSIRRFLHDLLRDKFATDDAVQETFTRAHVQLIKLPEPETFRPWLFGIARNVAFEFRRVRSFVELESDDAGIPVAVLPSPNPETLLLDEELKQQFADALNELSIPRKAALLMRVDHGLSYDEISEATGWSIPTVKNEIHRARLSLRESLRPHLGENS